jgi:hypothetical protein
MLVVGLFVFYCGNVFGVENSCLSFFLSGNIYIKSECIYGMLGYLVE